MGLFYSMIFRKACLLKYKLNVTTGLYVHFLNMKLFDILIYSGHCLIYSYWITFPGFRLFLYSDNYYLYYKKPFQCDVMPLLISAFVTCISVSYLEKQVLKYFFLGFFLIIVWGLMLMSFVNFNLKFAVFHMNEISGLIATYG